MSKADPDFGFFIDVISVSEENARVPALDLTSGVLPMTVFYGFVSHAGRIGAMTWEYRPNLNHGYSCGRSLNANQECHRSEDYPCRQLSYLSYSAIFATVTPFTVCVRINTQEFRKLIHVLKATYKNG